MNEYLQNESTSTNTSVSAGASQPAKDEDPGRKRLEFLLKQSEIFTHFMTTNMAGGGVPGGAGAPGRRSKSKVAKPKSANE